MRLSIILLNWRKKELTLACITSLWKFYPKQFDNGEFEVIIVDNASGDDSVLFLREHLKKNRYTNFTVVENDENNGFGAGCNEGVRHARGKYVLFLNNDTVVCDNHLVDMISYLDTHEFITILGGQLKNPDGSLQASAGEFYTPFNIVLLLLGGQKFGLLDKSPKKIQPVDWVKGGCLMIRKDAFDKLGGFDERIFMYVEDMELCYRARLVGQRTYFYPEINIMHAEHGSSNRATAIMYIYKNILYFYRKHRPYAEYVMVKMLLVIKAHFLVFFGKITGNTYFIQTYEKALSVL